MVAKEAEKRDERDLGEETWILVMSGGKRGQQRSVWGLACAFGDLGRGRVGSCVHPGCEGALELPGMSLW